MQNEFIEKYENIKKTKNIVVHANFRGPSQREIIRRYMEKCKESGIKSFSEFDFTCSNMVSIMQFNQVLQVKRKHICICKMFIFESISCKITNEKKNQ